MTKPRKKVPAKLRAELQKEIDSRCPICTNMDVGHFEIHHLDENPENNSPENLLMLCRGCHSKITKGDISPNEAIGIKRTLLVVSKFRFQQAPSQSNIFHGSVEGSVIGSGNTVTIKNTTKKVKKEKYPPGCIGHNILQANYISYLISRYHEYKEWEVGKENMKYSLFPTQLKRHFKIGAHRTIYNLPDSRFSEVCLEVQRRIIGTKFGRVKKSSQSLFRSFEEYEHEQRD